MRAALLACLVLATLLSGCAQKDKDADELVVRFENNGKSELVLTLTLVDPDDNLVRSLNGTSVRVPALGHSERNLRNPVDGSYDVKVDFGGGQTVETRLSSDKCSGRQLLTFEFRHDTSQSPALVLGDRTQRCA